MHFNRLCLIIRVRRSLIAGRVQVILGTNWNFEKNLCTCTQLRERAARRLGRWRRVLFPFPYYLLLSLLSYQTLSNPNRDSMTSSVLSNITKSTGLSWSTTFPRAVHCCRASERASERASASVHLLVQLPVPEDAIDAERCRERNANVNNKCTSSSHVDPRVV